MTWVESTEPAPPLQESGTFLAWLAATAAYGCSAQAQAHGGEGGHALQTGGDRGAGHIDALAGEAALFEQTGHGALRAR
jgi:hypothetical protein